MEPEDKRRKSPPNFKLDLNPWIIFPLAAFLGFFGASLLNQPPKASVSFELEEASQPEAKSFHKPHDQTFSQIDILNDPEASETEPSLSEETPMEDQVSSTSGDDLDDLVNKLKNLNRVLIKENSEKSEPIALNSSHDAQLQES